MTSMQEETKEKKGGPYTKDERLRRQNEVSRLYFEYGYSATKISETMKVNRNTINADIKCIYSNIKDEIVENSSDFILKQIGRLEAQRSRIVKNITENTANLGDSIRYEKILLDIDTKINELMIRIKTSKNIKSKKNKLSDEEIRDFVLYLLVKHSKNHRLNEKKIKSEIINVWQSSVDEAEEIFRQIENAGMKYCRREYRLDYIYDLVEFAFLRRYLLPNDAFLTKLQELFIVNAHFEEQVKDLNKKFMSKHGKKGGWPDEIFEKYNKEYREFRTKYAEISSKVIAEALEEISEQKSIERYTKFINVFFAEEKLQFQKLVET